MPISIVCPSCGRSGKLPDNFPGGRIKCPACQVINTVEGRPNSQPKPSARPAPAQPVMTAVIDDDEDDDGAESSKGWPERNKSASLSPAIYALIGAGGVLGVLALIGGLVWMMKPGAPADEPAPEAILEIATTPPPAAPISAPSPPAVVAQPISTPAPAVESVAARTTSPTPTPTLTTNTPEDLPDASPFSIQKLKDATVFLKVQAGKVAGSGSGFVIRVDGDKVLVATNHHVISLDSDEDTPSKSENQAEPNISAVFRSGTGSATEQSAKAEIIATSRDGTLDLAILSVQGIKNPPQPISLGQKTDPVETMPVLIFGFPFGKMLNTAKGNPAITINKGSVSSLRRDDSNQVALVQIDGSLNPGNSGGPVVDAQGRLIGVSVAQVRNTTIGFAVPAREVSKMLDGQVGHVALELKAIQAGSADVEARANLIDPLNRIKIVEFRYAPVDDKASPPKAADDGSWPPLPGARKVDMTIAQRAAIARFQTPFSTTGSRRILVQAAFRHPSGRTIYSSPERFELPLKPGAVASEHDPSEDEADVTIAQLAPLIDPSKDCTMTQEGRGLTITVPGTLHILSPELKTKNAPMVLTDVSGDFSARVKVTGDIQPGTQPVRNVPFPFQGAGLLLWKDKDNFLRLERSAGTKGNLSLVHRVLLEVCKDGKTADHNYIDIPEGALHFRFVRKGSTVQCMFGPDGKKWVAFPKLVLEYPDKVRVGLSASNTSKKPFTAQFEDFALDKASDNEDDEVVEP